MIEYVVPGNIDDRILERSSRMLAEGALLALPTDTSWSIVCSLRSRAGICKLRRLSGERDERRFTLLCASIAQFGEFCSLDNSRFRLINRLSPGPYVFILKPLLGAEKALGLRRAELGVRIPNYDVPLSLIKTLGCPLYSITAKHSMVNAEWDDANAEAPADEGLLPIREEELFEGGWELEGIKGIDCILDGGEDRERTFSTILDISGDEVKLLRQGAGPWPI
ncbi:MAG: Sua5/YciO/YrdC/YwlC family protein [Treponema sp.]|jgi:tRNA threonylcarbamoyl adenosine modification protein (Sua5/YciO/YrdC/YwlC family)|nr:Sua5/YciO/YrdC/YwlC family protein [Treponema sp.]